MLCPQRYIFAEKPSLSANCQSAVVGSGPMGTVK